MSIMEHNGSGILAMAGKNCVAIAADTRYGIGGQTVATDMNKVFRVNDKLFFGLPGLATDMQTLQELFRFKTNMYKLNEGRDITPKTFGNLVSSTLYERRFGPWFCEPVVAGLDEKNEPYLVAMDLIGAPVFTNDFVVGGTSSEMLYGVAETFYKPDLGPEELFEVAAQCLLSATDRDCTAGWGGVVHVITPERVVSRYLKSRMD
eukprot:TRINITY_DN8433_c0_g1_i2.p1 TRINITY_DN8433_c0_g1~~TRINITY_DN8433_c0_g1_i2.p1  ORF type:complete len:205 (+),score=29.96 TRINITY_DN8433_c0_g1_i2:393-1007(+)